MALDKIIIKGAREHNLKNVNLEIPRDKLIVLQGCQLRKKLAGV
jgi:excinuclease ABC subunit A